MADVGIFTKNADIQARAGIYANATSKAVAATDVYVLNVEGWINSYTRYNWSDWYAGSPNVDVKGILTLAGACLCAINVIRSDMSGYTTVQEAQTMIQSLQSEADKAMKMLEDIKTRDFIINA